MRAVVAHGAHDVRVEDVEPQHAATGEVEVAVSVGGICGSDLHYFHRGGVGDFIIQQPLVLGHEVAGTVVGLGEGVGRLRLGDPVAIDPSRPCGVCAACSRGAPNLCSDMRFLGSAARFPHTQGGFRERLVVSADQCVVVPHGVSLDQIVLAEPLAVAFHAAERAGDLEGKRVLVMGAGPIGVLIAVATRCNGADEVVVADLLESPLTVAAVLGASRVVNVGAGERVDDEMDLAFEATGAPTALETCLGAVRAGGRVVLVGLFPAGELAIAMNRAVVRELELHGSFRFRRSQFRRAVEVITAGLDLSPLVTSQFALDDAVQALGEASARERAMKVQLSIGGAG